ncbi:hypothetical protein LWI29_020787 [Acer saccharum]|uniref:Uncharacterized protein n=1 Tax=Acer saccharum TaxID=4024 RepID=A0AA39W6P0_ACESA|nr:hypothetical protein LWI29_020787 [Acer saccharum]
MKGGNYYRLRGRRLSLTLIAVLFTTILLWVCEKNNFVTTLLSGQDQFTWPSSESLVDAADNSSNSLTPKGHTEDESFESSSWTESDGDKTFSTKKKGCVCLNPLESSRTDCIGSAFNMKGAMQCPNCWKVEKAAQRHLWISG